MLPKLIILRSVLKRFSDVEDFRTGEIHGIIYDGNLLIVGLGFYKNQDTFNISSECVYPAGIDWCGLYKICPDRDTSFNKSILNKLKEVAVTNNPVYICKIVGERCLAMAILCNDVLTECEFSVCDEDELDNVFFHLRLKSELTICLDSSTPTSLEKSLNEVKTKFTEDGVMFHFVQTEQYLHPSTMETISSNLCFNEIYSGIEPCEIRNSQLQGVYEVNIFWSTTKDNPYQGEDPELKYCHSKKNLCFVHLPIDILCIVKKSRLIQESYGILMDSLCRWLDLVQNHFLTCDSTLGKFSIKHFRPKPLGHYTSVIFPDVSDHELEAKRRELHYYFNFSVRRPHFRIGNAIEFGPKDVPLNVHCGIRHDRVPNGNISIVRGDYGYYHYQQDSFNDKGWGCAYRSLQTIFSWFRLQGYTTKGVPSHKEIQECLVKLGDKPSSFIGTNSWIGSTEISYCLDEMLGVSSVILNVSSSEELGTLGSQLEYHFRNSGSPVMIGGGCLAHTILGVDFNEDSGALKFLILDPHYISSTGKEDLKRIRKEGVFWKSLEFWSKNNFYNLCLPQTKCCY